MMKAGEECVFESAPANYVDFELRFLGPQSHSLIGSFHRWLHVSGNFRLFSLLVTYVLMAPSVAVQLL